jgi:L-serine dehydratase
MSTTLPVSIFNDVLGPVMRGASSSHCAAALRIGRLARDLMDGNIQSVIWDMDIAGSLPATHDGQGSDMGLCGGLLGWEATDERLPESPLWLKKAAITLDIRVGDWKDPHPNTYRLTLKNQHQTRELIALSTGGGMIEVIAIDGFAFNFMGDRELQLLFVESNPISPASEFPGIDANTSVHIRDDGHGFVAIRGSKTVSDAFATAVPKTVRIVARHTLEPVLPVTTKPGMQALFTDCEGMLRGVSPSTASLADLAVQYESARGCVSYEEVRRLARQLITIFRNSIEQGRAGTEYADRILPTQTPAFESAMKQGTLLDAGALNRILLYVSALMEVKSSMGVIVAAPTAGACAALPGAILGMADHLGKSDDAAADALLAAGLIGVFIASSWTFAAEVGGCQAEGGSAASMAAAALVTLAGGTHQQAITASAMALQNMLGLICDPVANRVEVPCLGKNIMAASNALACANLALAGFDGVIPLDEVIRAARDVSSQMPRELRCTGLGGLAATPTSATILDRLAKGQGNACSSCQSTGC